MSAIRQADSSDIQTSSRYKLNHKNFFLSDYKTISRTSSRSIVDQTVARLGRLMMAWELDVRYTLGITLLDLHGYLGIDATR